MHRRYFRRRSECRPSRHGQPKPAKLPVPWDVTSRTVVFCSAISNVCDHPQATPHQRDGCFHPKTAHQIGELNPAIAARRQHVLRAWGRSVALRRMSRAISGTRRRSGAADSPDAYCLTNQVESSSLATWSAEPRSVLAGRIIQVLPGNRCDVSGLFHQPTTTEIRSTLTEAATARFQGIPGPVLFGSRQPGRLHKDRSWPPFSLYFRVDGCDSLGTSGFDAADLDLNGLEFLGQGRIEITHADN